jgi:hypothetical protein
MHRLPPLFAALELEVARQEAVSVSDTKLVVGAHKLCAC